MAARRDGPREELASASTGEGPRGCGGPIAWPRGRKRRVIAAADPEVSAGRRLNYPISTRSGVAALTQVPTSTAGTCTASCVIRHPANQPSTGGNHATAGSFAREGSFGTRGCRPWPRARVSPGRWDPVNHRSPYSKTGPCLQESNLVLLQALPESAHHPRRTSCQLPSSAAA